jgi:hypothetical protein
MFQFVPRCLRGWLCADSNTDMIHLVLNNGCHPSNYQGVRTWLHPQKNIADIFGLPGKRCSLACKHSSVASHPRRTHAGKQMPNDFDEFGEDDDDGWPAHNSYLWYFGIFVCGTGLAIFIAYFFDHI